MQKGREVQDNVFKSRGFGDFGGFGFHKSMTMPSLFGGRDPFDDPFFTHPLDNMRNPSSTSSRSMQKSEKTSREKGVVIKELDSDDEDIDSFDEKFLRSSMEPSVEHPDDDDVNGNVFDLLFIMSLDILTNLEIVEYGSYLPDKLYTVNSCLK